MADHPAANGVFALVVFLSTRARRDLILENGAGRLPDAEKCPHSGEVDARILALTFRSWWTLPEGRTAKIPGGAVRLRGVRPHCHLRR